MSDNEEDNALPEQVLALSQARKEHAQRMGKMQTVLAELQAEYTHAKEEQSKKLLRENELYSKLCALQTEGMRRQQNVTQLEKDVSRLCAVSKDLEWKLKTKEAEAKQKQRTFQEYRSKMDKYRERQKNAEKKIPAVIELELLQKEIQDMEQKKSESQDLMVSMMAELNGTGSSMEDANESIRSLETSLEQKKEHIKRKEEEVINLQDEGKKVETANKILVNRNAARLKKLRRQVEEQRQKYESMSAFVETLSRRITSVKEKLDKIVSSETEHQHGRL